MLSRNGLAAAVSVVLVGCAATPPEPTEYYSATAKQLASKRGVLLVTACHLRDEVGADKVMVSPSSAATESMSTGVSAYLTAYGLAPAGPVIRMMCAGMPRDQNDGLEFIPSIAEKDKAVPGTLPYVFGEGSTVDAQFDAATATNLHKMANDAYTAIMKKTGDAPSRGRLWLSAEQVAQLRAATGADYAWVVAADSVEVSGGKVVGSAILTATLSLGMVASAPTGGRQSMVALIDLENPAVIWRKFDGTLAGSTGVTATNTGARTPTFVTDQRGTSSAAPAETGWAAALFAPFLAPGQELAGKGVQPAAAEPPVASAPAVTAPAGESSPPEPAAEEPATAEPASAAAGTH